MRSTLVTTICCALLVGLWIPGLAQADERPRVAVLEFENRAQNQWWYNRGAQAAQDVFITELVRSGRFRVIERSQLEALMREQNLSLSGTIDPNTAVRAGRVLGVDYFLVGALTEYGDTTTRVDAPGTRVGGRWVPGTRVGRNNFAAAMNARLIDTETGEIVWADEGRAEDTAVQVRVGGYGGGVDRDTAQFDKTLKPMIQQLVASMKAADL
jgi:curli biogenesis system outer membrane secretion channel CsgG